ncbi:hypothetical protein ACQY0O_006898 [Thecaphora frezii]
MPLPRLLLSSLLPLLLLLSLLVPVCQASLQPRDGWRPASELDGSFVLGQGTTGGVKVKGYQGEWPLWSQFRKELESHRPAADGGGGVDALSTQTKTETETSSTGTKVEGGKEWRCRPSGACQRCPESVRYLPYCRPYNNRQPLVCTRTAPTDSTPASLQVAWSDATSIVAYESCGKVVHEEARDFAEFVTCIAIISIASVVVFVQRQRVLFQRQNRLLASRVSGRKARG